MKTKPRKPAPAAPPVAAKSSRWQICALGALAGLIAVFWAYGPAMNGALVFDDNFLPFAISEQAALPLGAWLKGVRPLLMFTYWINARLSPTETYSYHVLNVLIHCLTAGLVFIIVRRLLGKTRGQTNLSQGAAFAPRGQFRLSPDPSGQATQVTLAGFAAALFLLHPVQAEAVAYITGRSDALSSLFAFAAFALLLYRHDRPIAWPTVAAILALFAAALLSKEQAIALPALLLLTDYWWNPGFSFQGIRANWRLYAPLVLGALAGVVLFWRSIINSRTAGFGLKDFTWYQYFFTQCRALFVYLREFILPVNLTADWDFPISRSILDRGAIFGLAALLALSAAAWHYRRRFPLATFGWFAFLVLMAPTSSILPIQDPVAERRLYFAMPGLLLILVDALSRLRVDRKVLAAACLVVLLAAATATHARASVWADPLAFWEDAVLKSPNKFRDRFYLGFTYYHAGSFQQAITQFEKSARLQPPTYDLLVDWGMAYANLNQPDQALDKLYRAADLKPSGVVWVDIATVYANRSDWRKALGALDTAQQIEPSFPETYVNRGKIFLALHQLDAAVRELQHARVLDPTNEDARTYLLRALQEQRR